MALAWLLLWLGRKLCVLLCFQPCHLSTALYTLLLAALVMDATFTWELFMLLLLTPSPQLTAVPPTPMLLVQHEFLFADARALAKPGSEP